MYKCYEYLARMSPGIVFAKIFNVLHIYGLNLHDYRSNQSALMTRCATDSRNQYGIFCGESQTSFSRNATRVGSDEGRLFSQANLTTAKADCIWDSLVLHCASLLRTILASSARAQERVHVQNVRDFPQTKLDNGINSPFLLNGHGDPRYFFQAFAKNSLMKNIFEEGKNFDSRT